MELLLLRDGATRQNQEKPAEIRPCFYLALQAALYVLQVIWFSILYPKKEKKMQMITLLN